MNKSTYEPTKYSGVFSRTDNNNKKKFYIRYVVGGRGGKQVFECLGGAEAGWTAAKASLERADRIRGKTKSNSEKRRAAEKKGNEIRWTLNNLWEAYKEANPKKSRSRDSDESLYKNHLKKPFGGKTVDELTTMEIDRFRNKLSREGLKPSSIWHAMELMRRLFNFGDRQGYCVVPRTLHFNFPKVDNEKTEMLDDDEMIRFLKALEEYTSYKFADEKEYFVAYGKLIMHTGIRRSAAVALRWDDCDFEKGFITLRGETAKSKKTQRIPMSPFVHELLSRLPHGNGDFIFPQRYPDTYTRYMSRVRNLAGVSKDFRPIHGLRHNFASRVASSGKVDLYTLQNLMTHSSPAMTQRYAHLADKAMHRAASVIDDVMNVPMAAEEGEK